MTLSLVVSDVIEEADRVRSFDLRPVNGGNLPSFEAGAHIAVHLGNGLVRQYSLANDPAERERYLIGVLKERNSRGGSAWIFDRWKPGERIEVEPPANHFPLAKHVPRHVLIAGGIGITPMLAMVQTLGRGDADYSLFYCTRRRQETAFRELLCTRDYRDHVQLIHDDGDPRQGLNLQELLKPHASGTHVYVCGPAGLIKAVRNATAQWPADCVHFEYFAADPDSLSGTEQAEDAFTIQIASTGQMFEVPAGCSALSVLSENGIDVPRLCEEGVCGSCLTAIKEGIPDHRDSIQTEAERASNEFMTLCCSRAKSSLLILDL